jgi:hypothetical protein
MSNLKKGSSLILALIMTSAIVTTTGVIYTFSSNQVHQSKKTVDLIQARAISESGIGICYASLKSDITAINRPDDPLWATTSFDGGSFQVTPSIVASNAIVLTSMGTFRNAKSKNTVNLRYYPSCQIAINNGKSSGDTIYGPYVFNHALYVGGTCDWRGGGTFSGGNVYVNGQIDLGGNGSWTKGIGTLNVYSSTKVTTSGSADLDCTSVMALRKRY